jgi:hypothetical protein
LIVESLAKGESMVRSMIFLLRFLPLPFLDDPDLVEADRSLSVKSCFRFIAGVVGVETALLEAEEPGVRLELADGAERFLARTAARIGSSMSDSDKAPAEEGEMGLAFCCVATSP